MGSSLKNFIQAVRGAKTISEEKKIIQKESAAIRGSFREESVESRKRRTNVAKLLYLFTLGERTQFGQIECLKLIGSSKFSDKRLGYLGITLLLDENQQVLTLVTNSLQNDLLSNNDQIAGLALCALSHIASPEMSIELHQTIQKLFNSPRAYIRKKAILCAVRIIKKAPDLIELFGPISKTLLMDTERSILHNSLTLSMTICELDASYIKTYKNVSTITQELRLM